MDRDEKSRLFDFFAAERKKLNHYIHSKVQSIDDMEAEDMVEDVMLGILSRLTVSGRVDNLSAYVYRSIHNRIVDYLRTGARTVSLQGCMDEDGEVPILELLADSSTKVSDEVERKEFMRRLSQAISRLEPKQRAIFVATELKGMSFKELSEQWQEPVGTLLSRKCRAVKALQEMLKDLKPE
jgi:RNA polymerase sigma factor (sigma-70 family)